MYIYIYIYIHTYVCSHVCIYTNMCIFVYVQTYVCKLNIYIHTYKYLPIDQEISFPIQHS